ncbi:hypothetical protein U9M48_042094 [Paspalum notatum var. saurae]|uniref:Uncharacterized protein n=1 Tax=Paspalum notatum var. saurae TaxID=547442 RepID=A0AAQ3XE48_PASNO
MDQGASAYAARMAELGVPPPPTRRRLSGAGLRRRRAWGCASAAATRAGPGLRHRRPRGARPPPPTGRRPRGAGPSSPMRCPPRGAAPPPPTAARGRADGHAWPGLRLVLADPQQRVHRHRIGRAACEGLCTGEGRRR